MLVFYIYKSLKNNKFYWHLDEIINIGYNDGNIINNIIATGHQSYNTIDEAREDIKKVISAIPSTKIEYIGYQNEWVIS